MLCAFVHVILRMHLVIWLTKPCGLHPLEWKCFARWNFSNFWLPLKLCLCETVSLRLCGQRGLCAFMHTCFLCSQAMAQWAGDGFRSKSWVSPTTRAGCTGRKRAKASWASNGRSTGLCWRRHPSTGTPTSWWVKHAWIEPFMMCTCSTAVWAFHMRLRHSPSLFADTPLCKCSARKTLHYSEILKIHTKHAKLLFLSLIRSLVLILNLSVSFKFICSWLVWL